MSNVYTDYNKPSFAPPGWLFAPVWAALYVLIAISFVIVVNKVAKGECPAYVLIPIILNLILNAAYYPAQFIFKSMVAGTVIIFGVLITLIASMAVIYKYSKAAFYMKIPYLLWVLFATVLQVSIVALN